ncbi:MAG: class I SAM-dependent methyltransferase [Candidatus Scalindua sp.]|jgi:2-polyprenyl-3-methyl-5-hydroxy-6-metoxy-1,4-benzoquinol methylase|nr:class I SAM-dependent methyltransferase [Candidatus Scalindua sp.]
MLESTSEEHKDLETYLQVKAREKIHKDLHLQDTMTLEKVKTYNPFNDSDKNTREAMEWLYYDSLSLARSMVDLGCGVGLPTMAIALHLNIPVLAIDGSKLLVGFAEAMRTKCGIGNVTFLNALIDDNLSEGFDVAFSMHTLEHLTCPERSLLQMKRIADTTCGIVPKEHANNSTEHLWHWTDVELRTLLVKVFKEVEVKEFGNLLAFVAR